MPKKLLIINQLGERGFRIAVEMINLKGEKEYTHTDS